MKMKTFMGKVTPQAVNYLNEHVNEWLDESGAKVWYVESVFGEAPIGMSGAREACLFINVWYNEGKAENRNSQ